MWLSKTELAKELGRTPGSVSRRWRNYKELKLISPKRRDGLVRVNGGAKVGHFGDLIGDG